MTPTLVTDGAAANDQLLYFTSSSLTAGDDRLVFISDRSGHPNLYVKTLPDGTLEGINDWKRSGYGGPCPPIGRHRYFFKLYALDAGLPDLRFPSKAVLEDAMRGHVIAETQLIGTYIKGQ